MSQRARVFRGRGLKRLLTVLGLACWPGFYSFAIEVQPEGEPPAAVAAPNGDAADAKSAAEAEAAAARAAALEADVTQGALRIVQKDGGIVECPLKHTNVQADIAGFVSRVTVTQTFHNPTKEKIEAVYVFPLPHEAAVDAMTMVVGEKRIVGLIKRRAEARAVYEAALAAGNTAALLEQERPNIFTQSVGNIEPGQEVKIEISYVDSLRYDMGTYEFQFPMVVGPRYIPGGAISSPQPTPAELQGKASPPVADTNRVPDASRISPPVLRPNVRNGHDIAVSIKLDAGVPIQGLKATNHQVETLKNGNRQATITLAAADSVPNKDFVLRYDVVGEKPELAMLTHTGNHADAKRLGNGYFMLMVQPKEDERLKKSPPREMVFLVDTSGSMSGEPTAKVIGAMKSMLKLCRENDTVQVITFASDARKLFDKPVPVNEKNIERAIAFTDAVQAGGGTEMLTGIKLAIDEPIDNERVRIIVMLTDGFIGNEAEIIEHVGKNCGDQVRFWCIGIGSSPNMMLVDGVAKQGGGMGKMLGLNDDTQALTTEVVTRIQRAQLSKIKIDWGGLQVAETYPTKLPELWAGRPLIVFGRYTGSGDATIALEGAVEGEAARWPLTVALPAEQKQHDALAKIWARRKIEDLMQQTFYQGSPAVEEEVTGIALDYKLMSQYTSFVAVDEKQAAASDKPAARPRRMLVPVPLPAGTQWEGFFGGEGQGEVDALSDSDFASSNDGVEIGLRNLSVADSRFGFARSKLQQAAKSERGGAVRLMKRVQDLSPAARPISAVAGRSSGFSAASAGIGGGAGQSDRYYPGANLGAGLRLGETRGHFGDTLLRRSERLSALQYSNGFAGEAFESEAVDDAPRSEPVAQPADANTPPAVAAASPDLTYVADLAAARSGRSNGEAATKAYEQLQAAHESRVAEACKQLPALSKPLELTLQDASLAAALQSIGKATGVEISLIDGSMTDAKQLVGETPLHIVYLDLRGATLAETLGEILTPAGLTWRLDDGKITAASARRLTGESTWIYDVSLTALPDAEALGKLDHAKAIEAAKAAAAKFLEVVREQAPKESAGNFGWFGPGQLYVNGDPALHAKVAKLLHDLADSDAKLTGAAAELQKATAPLAASRAKEVATIAAADKLQHIADEHAGYGWKLRAAAAGGKLDAEAFAHLRQAWNDPASAELLKGPGAVIALRSLWLMDESRKQLGADETELAAVVAKARKQAQGSLAAVRSAVAKDPHDTGAYIALLYAALSRLDETALAADTKLLTDDRPAGTPQVELTTLSRTLLSKPSEATTAALAKFIESSASGEDAWVLAAIASRRAGAEAWSQFRATAAERLGEQPLDDNVIVLLNRLSGPTPAATASR